MRRCLLWAAALALLFAVALVANELRLRSKLLTLEEEASFCRDLLGRAEEARSHSKAWFDLLDAPIPWNPYRVLDDETVARLAEMSDEPAKLVEPAALLDLVEQVKECLRYPDEGQMTEEELWDSVDLVMGGADASRLILSDSVPGDVPLLPLEPGRPVSPCQEALALLWVRASAAARSAAEAACAFGVEGDLLSEGLDGLPERVHLEIEALNAVLIAAQVALLDGDTATCEAHLLTALRLTELVRGRPFLLGFSWWTLMQSETFRVLRWCVVRFPTEYDPTPLVGAIREIEVEEYFRVALDRERSFGLHQYRLLRSESSSREGSPVSGVLRLLINHDELNYLEGMEILSEKAASPHYDKPDSVWEPMRFALVARMLTPDHDEHLKHLAYLRADLLLAEASLILQRDGEAACREMLARHVDPFGGGTIGMRRDESAGHTVLWSIGPDGVDDGGTRGEPTKADPGGVNHPYIASDDIAWHVRHD